MKRMSRLIRLSLAGFCTVVTALGAVPALAAAPGDTPASQRVSLTTPATAARSPDPARSLSSTEDGTWVFSAPPRESAEESARLYEPIAALLTRATGKKIVYRYPSNWLTYQTEMLRGGYDLVFDGPHFISWRLANQRHHTLAKLAEEHRFAVVVRKDNTQINELRQLTGQKVCAMNPPNLGTLAFLNEFTNPVRQPVLLDRVGWESNYRGVAFENRCVAAVVPMANLNKYDKDGLYTRVIYRSRTLPNQAFSAGPRIPREQQARITAALVGPEAQAATLALRTAYGSEKGLVPATQEDYAGLDSYLKDVWGYGR